MVPVKAVMMVVTLLTLCLLTSDTAAARPRCCHGYMKTKLAFYQIKGYSVQPNTEVCSISAIIFLKKNGNIFCADPAKDWVMDYISRLKTKAEIEHKKSLGYK